MWLLYFSTAYAGAGGEGEGPPMLALLWGLFLLAFVYLTAHFLVERLQRNYLFSSGIEYIALGIGLSYIAVFQNMHTYLPAITFAIGWIGLMFGMQFSPRKCFQDRVALRLVFTEIVLVGFGVGTFAALFIYTFVEKNWDVSIACGGMLGSAALATSSSAIDVVKQRFPSLNAHVLGSLFRASQLNNLFAIIIFGLMVCRFRSQLLVPQLGEFDPFVGGAILAGMTILFGLILALLYAVFLIENDSEQSRFLAMTGIICFAAGAAFYVGLPVLVLTLSLGLGLLMTKNKASIFSMMDSAKKPVLLILLIFAGVQFTNVPFAKTALLFFGFVIFRFLLKALSSWLSSYGSSIRGDIFRGHLAQGEISLAIAMSFHLLLEGPAVDMAYAVAIASVALHELFSPRWLRGLLIDLGEIRDDVTLMEESGHGRS